MRLFSERGYEATSVDEIAHAVEVSPSTVYRYFPNKPDILVYDDLDDRFLAAFRAQPRDLNTVDALCATVRAVFGGLAGADMARAREREQLLRSVPDLRAAMLGEFAGSARQIAELVAERAGRSADDDAVIALAGAVIGLCITAWFTGDGDSRTEAFLEQIDTGMALLASGFRL